MPEKTVNLSKSFLLIDRSRIFLLLNKTVTVEVIYIYSLLYTKCLINRNYNFKNKQIFDILFLLYPISPSFLISKRLGN